MPDLATHEPLMAPDDIQRRSFEIISALLPSTDQSGPEWSLIRRIVHTTGDPAIAALIMIHPDAVAAGIKALRSGCRIVTDVKMVAAGIDQGRAASLGCEVICALAEPGVAEMAASEGITRGAAGIFRQVDRLPGTVVAIGNAPTALFALLGMLRAGTEPPALVVGTPVGFVGAAESKQLLVEQRHPDVPYVTIQGTRGGSAIAATTVNALLRLALAENEAESVRGKGE